MPVQTIIGKGHPNPFAIIVPPKALRARARVNSVRAAFTLDASVSVNSVLVIGRVPTGAIISPRSSINTAAITSAAVHVGLDRGGVISGSLAAPVYTPSAGAVQAALASGQTLATAALLNGCPAVTAANADKAVWELLGLTSDPGDMATIYATVSAVATASGAAVFEYVYSSED